MKRCSRCGTEHDRPGRYCRQCHASYMRDWRRRQKARNQHLVAGHRLLIDIADVTFPDGDGNYRIEATDDLLRRIVEWRQERILLLADE